ncbi:Steroid 17-alpha-hydroxylase 17-20 [Brachionus plicatilis]|uniref:Steroid 17-alpha-hydroxylase 17-20 n=1 Tax=Brachionus plicatilis TaxID=10195 RepID=A0A3M7PC52_BRAPC|nr:Steroid 17-alpha-hydroxylase 17-20 [Brachionus plicatilis]
MTNSICSSSHKRLTLVKNKEGRFLTTEKEQGQRWVEHFREVLNRLEPLESNGQAYKESTKFLVLVSVQADSKRAKNFKNRDRINRPNFVGRTLARLF